MTQMVSGFCSLINGGDYYEPHVVKQIQNENGNVIENEESGACKTDCFPGNQHSWSKDYMRGVVLKMVVVKKANLEGYEVGGKDRHGREASS